jgi:ABC-type phosphate/phosphonate transport system permease subunit
MLDRQTFGILVFGSIGIATVAMVVGNPIALPLALFARVVCEVPYD